MRGTEHPEPFFSRKLRSELSLMYCKFGSLLQPFPVAADFFDLHLELEHNFFNLQYKFLYLQCKILYLQTVSIKFYTFRLS